MSVITSLVAYWSLEEASGTRNDSQGTYHLSDNNTVTSATGKVGTAAQFTAANVEYLSVADNADLSMPGDMTISAWVNPTALGAGSVRRIVAKDDFSTQREYGLFINNSNIPIFEVLDSFSGFSDAGGVVVASDTWVFLIATYTNSDKTPRLYQDDGAENAGSAIFNGIANTTAAFVLGAAGDTSQRMDGLIDEVGVWRRILTSGERTWLYNSGAGRSYADIVAEAGGAKRYLLVRN